MPNNFKKEVIICLVFQKIRHLFFTKYLCIINVCEFHAIFPNCVFPPERCLLIKLYEIRMEFLRFYRCATIRDWSHFVHSCVRSFLRLRGRSAPSTTCWKWRTGSRSSVKDRSEGGGSTTSSNLPPPWVRPGGGESLDPPSPFIPFWGLKRYSWFFTYLWWLFSISRIRNFPDSKDAPDFFCKNLI